MRMAQGTMMPDLLRGKLALVTGAGIEANDRLFDTLDPTTRKKRISDTQEILLSDTVGFIRKLPHHLVSAFKATLEELAYADLLLHVVDASNPGFPEQIQQVQKVLGEIGADDVPQILVFNKLDAIEPERQPAMLQDMYELDGMPVPRVFVSARSGQGLAQLRQMLADRVLQVREEAAREEVEGQDDTYWMSPDDEAQY